jgi:hypothetical protein
LNLQGEKKKKKKEMKDSPPGCYWIFLQHNAERCLFKQSE